MKKQNNRFTQNRFRVLGILALLTLSATLRGATSRYVSASGAASLDYGTGYSNLQAAIDASTAGDTVWIEDGFICNTGGTYSTTTANTNRIVVTKAITVRSVSGTKENAAVIVGAHHAPGVTTNGTAAIRCLYITAQATLIGLQLTNGATSAITIKYGGGAYMGSGGTGTTFSNCVIVANNAADYGGGVYGGGVFSHCSIIANVASTRAGGVYGGTLRYCEIIGNTALGGSGAGGGTYNSTAENCNIVGNSAITSGGSNAGTLSYCTLVSNTAVSAAGGVANGTLSHCLVAFNKAGQNGGGVSGSALRDCVLTGNSAAYNGAAINGGSALRCIITNNANSRIGGGVVYNCAVTNSLIKDNSFLGAYSGGVVNQGKLINSLLVGNKTTISLDAATAYNTQIFNSTVANNSEGKAVKGCTLINSIVWNNASAGLTNSVTNSCIAASAVLAGENNVDADPKFVGSGDWPYRLLGSSPCVDKGIGGFDWMLPSDPGTLGLDLSGRQRILGSAVDMGAFEYLPLGMTLIVR